MNDTVRIFLERHNINIPQISAKTDIKVYTGSDIDKTIEQYKITKPSIKGLVSIADILGYNGYENMIQESIFENLDNYFDINGDGYHQRSVSLLTIETSNLVTTLEESFHRDPVRIQQTSPEKYIIGGNGLHRFHVLKIHYLKELTESQMTPEDITKLNQKYTIPVEITPIDYIKTYSNFLLNKLLGKIWVSRHLDEHWKPTEKAQIDYHEETIILDDFELIAYVISKINTSKFKPYMMEIIQKEAEKSKTFKAFYETYLKKALEEAKEVEPNGIHQSKQ